MADSRELISSERIEIADNAVKALLGLLPQDLRFSSIIQRYLELPTIARNLEDEEVLAIKYAGVRNAITELWEESRKSADFLDDTQDFEHLLKELRMRDHFIHSFRVFLLGYSIINKINQLFPEERYFKFPERGYNLIWMLSATFHDSAYAIEKTDDWMNKFFLRFLGIKTQFFLRLPELLTPTYTDFLRMLSQHHKSPFSIRDNFQFSFNGMDWNYYDKVGEALLKKDHGVLGALMLCHRMAIKEGFLGGDQRIASGDEYNFLYYHLSAAHAISVHNIDVVIDFKRHPFAFMLVLCDEIQDWGRSEDDDKNEFIAIEELGVEKGQVPVVSLKLNASNGKIEKLAAKLSDRLRADEAIDIKINGKNLFS
jgi:hypothetical protein